LKYRWFALFVLLAALALAACAGGKTPVELGAGPDGPRDTAALEQVSTHAAPGGSPSEEYLAAEWEAWLADPGEPGVDHDPSIITVGYRPAALGFRSASAVHLPVGLSAAEQPNAVLRKEPRYEAITDSIAAGQPVTIRTQVYYGEVAQAAFDVDDGADSAAVLEAIRRDYAEYIEYASYATLYRQAFSPNDLYFTTSNSSAGPLWFMHRVKCADAWDYTKGDSEEWMADVDTGVRITHQDLVGQVLDPEVLAAEMGPGTFFDIENNDNTVEDISDSGHGTFIAGILGAAGNGGGPMVGVAYQSRIVPVKISDGGTAPDSDIVAGSLLGFEAGARAVNLSWGGYHHNPSMRNMVNTIYNGGGLLFGAAGNDATTDFHYPSDYANAISVGSTNSSDNRASFSNYSTAVDIAAPGVPLVSTGHHSDNDYHDSYVGTSFSCPMVAAAATLLWSYKPDLTNDEVRFLLISTGADTSGFQNTDPPVLRLDIEAALDAVDAIRITAPKPTAMIQQGTITLTPEVNGEPDFVEGYFNGELVDVLTSEPYTFEIDTTSVSFGRVQAYFVAKKNGEQASATVPLVVDNTQGNFPVVEDFESTSTDFAAVDLKGYSLGVLMAAKDIPGPGAAWTEDDVASQGPASWSKVSGGAYEGSSSMELSTAQNSYGGYELDALISRRIKLSGISDGTVVFYHHYNIEDGGSAYDRAWVYVTPDYGATLQPAKLKGGGDAFFTGYLANWTRADIDLSGFSGLVHVVLLFESDPLGSGEQAGADAGWWVDKITVSSNYNENVPSLTDVSVQPYSAYGSIPQLTQIDIAIGETRNVDRVRYILDVMPLGDLIFTGEFPDIIVDAAESPFGGVITDLPQYPNQLADLRIQYFDEENNQGPEIILPVYIFNQLGDVNADNTVDAADHAAYDGMVGLTDADPAYNPLFDSDMDGVITESDAAAVGYFWGNSI
jgi:thermitase